MIYKLDGDKLIEEQKGSFESVNVRALEGGQLIMVTLTNVILLLKLICNSCPYLKNIYIHKIRHYSKENIHLMLDGLAINIFSYINI